MTTPAVPDIPGYRIDKEIGRGGMAVVYLAEQASLGRPVALKIMAASLAGDEEFRKRFLREGATVARLSHPGIVKVFDTSVYGSLHYIAMEYLPGGTLRQRVIRGLELDHALALFRAVTDALGYAHGQGVIHRDIKSQNILLYADGTPVLSDFGIAKAVSSQTESVMTAPGVMVGSIRYMSPEQVKGERVDQRSDLYALGVLFYELLTGILPYDAGDSFAIAFKHVNDPLPQLPPRLARFQPIIDGLLAKLPEQRFSDAGALASALDDAELNRSAVAPGPTPQASAPTVVVDSERVVRRQQRRQNGSLRRAIAAAVAVLLLAGGAAGVWQYRRAQNEQQQARLAEQQRRQALQEQARLAEQQRRQALQEQQRRVAAQRQREAEQRRLADQRRHETEQRLRDQQTRRDEQRRVADQARREAEQQRLAEQARRDEARRLAERQRTARQQRAIAAAGDAVRSALDDGDSTRALQVIDDALRRHPDALALWRLRAETLAGALAAAAAHRNGEPSSSQTGSQPATDAVTDAAADAATDADADADADAATDAADEQALRLSRAERTRVQQGLNRLGYDVGRADGVFGSRTRTAIRLFQRDGGGDASGFLDRALAERLLAAAAEADAAKTADAAGATVVATAATTVAPAASDAVGGDFSLSEASWRPLLDAGTELAFNAAAALAQPRPQPPAFVAVSGDGCVSGDCRNGRGEYHFPGHGVYRGDWRDGRFHGEGSYFFVSGDIYRGGWRNNRRSGGGGYFYRDGSVYAGTFSDGVSQGRGRFYFANGDRYYGSWQGGSKHGPGLYLHGNGIRVYGTYSGDRLSGREVVVFYPDGDRYVGEWRNDKKHGKGIFYASNGSKYAGLWENNVTKKVGNVID